MTLSPSSSVRARAFALAVVLWAFGLATTTLLVGVWGRSVTNDTAALSESALAALDPDTVSQQITDWLASEAGELPGISASATTAVVQSVASSPPARVAIESIVTDIVDAATAPAGSETVIDVASAVEPLRPVVIASLEQSGIPASPAEVDGFLRQIEGLVLTSADRTSAANSLSSARSTLTVVILVGAAGLVAFGAVALRLSKDRSLMLRSLANRLIVSSLTFALFLRISAWAVDPGGGRSPLRASGSILLASNTWAVVAIAVAAALVSAVTSMAIRRVKRRRLPRDPGPAFDPVTVADPATRPSDAELDRTRRRASVR